MLGLEVVMDHGWIMTLADPDNRAAQVSLISTDATAAVIPDISISVDVVDAVRDIACRLGFEVLHPLTDEP